MGRGGYHVHRIGDATSLNMFFRVILIDNPSLLDHHTELKGCEHETFICDCCMMYVLKFIMLKFPCNSSFVYLSFLELLAPR